jgi:hypothetical protein
LPFLLPQGPGGPVLKQTIGFSIPEGLAGEKLHSQIYEIPVLLKGRMFYIEINCIS